MKPFIILFKTLFLLVNLHSNAQELSKKIVCNGKVECTQMTKDYSFCSLIKPIKLGDTKLYLFNNGNCLMIDIKSLEPNIENCFIERSGFTINFIDGSDMEIMNEEPSNCSGNASFCLNNVFPDDKRTLIYDLTHKKISSIILNFKGKMIKKNVSIEQANTIMQTAQCIRENGF